MQQFHIQKAKKVNVKIEKERKTIKAPKPNGARNQNPNPNPKPETQKPKGQKETDWQHKTKRKKSKAHKAKKAPHNQTAPATKTYPQIQGPKAQTQIPDIFKRTDTILIQQSSSRHIRQVCVSGLC